MTSLYLNFMRLSILKMKKSHFREIAQALLPHIVEILQRRQNMFWKIFYQLCQDYGKSPNAIAKELGISSGSITSWKNGRVPHNTTLLKIAEYFGVSVKELRNDE